MKKNHVSNLTNEFQNLYTNQNDLYEQLEREIKPLFTEESKETSTITSSGNSGRGARRPEYETDPLRTTDPLRVINPPRIPVPPTNIGRSDLDPFSNFDPMGTGG